MKEKVGLALKALATIVNWRDYFLDCMGLRRGNACYVLRHCGRKIRIRCRYGSDRHMLADIFLRRVYTKFFDVERGDLVFDIGANVGMFSLYSFVKAKEVVAVEPEPENFDFLLRNISVNKAGNIEPVNAAVSRRTGTATLFISGSTPEGHSLCKKWSGGNPVSVKTYSIQKLFEMFGVPDFLKLDCEGCEYSTILGNKRNLKKVGRMVIEYHNLGGGKNGTALYRFLKRNKFDVVSFYPENRQWGYIYVKNR